MYSLQRAARKGLADIAVQVILGGAEEDGSVADGEDVGACPTALSGGRGGWSRAGGTREAHPAEDGWGCEGLGASGEEGEGEEGRSVQCPLLWGLQGGFNPETPGRKCEQKMFLMLGLFCLLTGMLVTQGCSIGENSSIYILVKCTFLLDNYTLKKLTFKMATRKISFDKFFF